MSEVYVERVFRITVGNQCVIADRSEAEEVIADLSSLLNEPAVSCDALDLDDDESAMSLRKLPSKTETKQGASTCTC